MTDAFTNVTPAASKLLPCEKRKYSKTGAYTLQELDMFTIQFNDDNELRSSLLYGGVLQNDSVGKPLSIRWCSKGEYTKVPYDFLYQRDIDFVVDPGNLVEVIMRRYYNRDFYFIKKFAEHFVNYYECSTTASEVRMYADMALNDSRCSKYLEETDRNGNNMVERLVKLLLLEHYENANGYIDYKDKIKYRNLHMMIAFINHYDVKHGIVSEMRKFEVKDMVSKEPVKTRKRSKKDEVPGQISFFDMFDDGSN